MHICIIGTGAAGWISYHVLKHHPAVDKITIIGSPDIPSIGVGESTTLCFYRFIHKQLGLNQDQIDQLLVDIDAAIKYGVSYEGWSDHTFLHHFGVNHGHRTKVELSGYLLGKKPADAQHNHYAVPLEKYIYNNQIYLDRTLQSFSYHFDAGKFIQAMKNLALQDSKCVFISDTVTDLVYDGEIATHAVLKSGENLQAEYFVGCVGQTAFNQKIFGETYRSYSDVLLTNKALFYPLEYTNPEREFHPYTIARTMPHGWRWITPTRKLRADTGISDLDPFVVDFAPRKIQNTFRKNSCSLGLAGGFLEPLDAPGLSLTFTGIDMLLYIRDKSQNDELAENSVQQANRHMDRKFDFWCSFILHQYKTCCRSDTKFWQDHKSVKFDHYDKLVSEAFDPVVYTDSESQTLHLKYSKDLLEPWMFYNTTSGKSINWKTNINSSLKNYRHESIDIEQHLLLGHREFIESLTHRKHT